jgi:hypothetical protein
MSYNKYFKPAIFAALLFASCKKDQIEAKSRPMASLVVVNSITSGGDVKLNTVDRDSAKAYNYKTFSLLAGNTQIKLYPINNPTFFYYNSVRNIINGGVYSLFLSGQGTAVDTVFIKDEIQPFYDDSTLGVRVINLSPNSGPLNVTLAATPTVNLFAGIAYKQLTSFAILPLKSVVAANSVSFQIKDASNNLLSTYILPATANSTYPGISILNSRNRNLTLVIKGLVATTSGSDAFGVFPVANY